jgi:hypothetical protein
LGNKTAQEKRRQHFQRRATAASGRNGGGKEGHELVMNVIGGSNCRDATLTLLGSLGLQQKKRITQVSGCQYGFEAGKETDGGTCRGSYLRCDYLPELQRARLGNRTQLSLRQ